MTTNAITPLPPEVYADQLIADRDNWPWNYGHLLRQYIALRDVGKGDTAVAIYTRKAIRAIQQGDTAAYEHALDEITKLCKKI